MEGQIEEVKFQVGFALLRDIGGGGVARFPNMMLHSEASSLLQRNQSRVRALFVFGETSNLLCRIVTTCTSTHVI